MEGKGGEEGNLRKWGSGGEKERERGGEVRVWRRKGVVWQHSF